MKIAHLTTVDSSLRYLIFPQLAATRDAGHETIGISAPGPWVEGLERDGIRHVPLPASTRGFDAMADAKAARQLWRILRDERVDILHTHNPKPGLYGRIVGRLAGVPTVVHTHHGLYATEDDRLAKRAVIYGLEAVASRFSHAELVQNPEDVDLLARLRITPKRKLRLLGNGVDLRRFDPASVSTRAREELRTSLGVGPEQVAVGMVGRLVAEKGYPELIAAAAELDERIVVLCVGPEDPEKADRLGLDDLRSQAGPNVRFLGFREDMPTTYAAMDAFILPSHREGFPRAAMEAAAMGLPVVATDIRGCRQVVEHEVNGLLIPVRDAGAIAMALRRLTEDSGLRTRMGVASRERAVAHFDEDDVVRIVVDTYADAASGFSSPSTRSGDG